MNTKTRRDRWCGISAYFALFLITASAQDPSPDHSIHHRGNTNSRATSSPQISPVPGESTSQPSASPGLGEMEQMMQRAATPPKELYPALMDLPELSRERRAEIERLAHERMESSKATMSAAFDRLARASERDDFTESQEAAAQLREALAQYESGLAAHHALAEGKAPGNIALLWFKREMNLMPSIVEPETSLFGLPSRWFHYFVIALLVFFVVAMLLMYFHKMRRAEKLLAQLTRDADKPKEVEPAIQAARDERAGG